MLPASHSLDFLGISRDSLVWNDVSQVRHLLLEKCTFLCFGFKALPLQLPEHHFQPNLRETGKRSFKWIILFIWVEDLFILKDFCLYFYCPFSIFFQRGLTTHLQKLFNQYSQTPCGIEYFTREKKQCNCVQTFHLPVTILWLGSVSPFRPRLHKYCFFWKHTNMFNLFYL